MGFTFVYTIIIDCQSIFIYQASFIIFLCAPSFIILSFPISLPPSLSLFCFIHSLFPFSFFSPMSFSLFLSSYPSLLGIVLANSRGQTRWVFYTTQFIGRSLIIEPEILGDPPIRSDEIIWSRLYNPHSPVATDDNRVFLANFNRWLVITSYEQEDNDIYIVEVARDRKPSVRYYTELLGKYDCEHYAYSNISERVTILLLRGVNS